MRWVQAALVRAVWIFLVVHSLDILSCTLDLQCAESDIQTAFLHRVSPNSSLTPRASTLLSRSPKVSRLELWTHMTESPVVLSHRKASAPLSHCHLGSQPHTLVVMAGSWGCEWQLRSGEERWNLCTLKSLSGVLSCTTVESSVHSPIWRADTQHVSSHVWQVIGCMTESGGRTILMLRCAKYAFSRSFSSLLL